MEQIRTDRTVVVIGVVIAALVVLSLIVVSMRGEPELLEQSTPEGVVQRYVAAVIDGDEQLAATFLTEEATANCDGFRRDPEQDIRVSLVSSQVFDGSADVAVSITTSYGSGPFGVSEYESQDSFDLVQVEGDWMIDYVPFELSTVCREVPS